MIFTVDNDGVPNVAPEGAESVGQGTVIDIPESPESQLEEVQQFAERVARRLLKEFPRVKRWEETNDICQRSLISLYQAIERSPVKSRRHLENLVAVTIRHTIIDTFRKLSAVKHGFSLHCTPFEHDGKFQNVIEGQADSGQGPTKRLELIEVHEEVDRLPGDLKEVFQLRVYSERTTLEVATILDVTPRTVQRRYRLARERLAEALKAHGYSSL